MSNAVLVRVIITTQALQQPFFVCYALLCIRRHASRDVIKLPSFFASLYSYRLLALPFTVFLGDEA